MTWPIKVTLGLAVLAGIYLTSLYNYLLFHAIVELFSIAVACGIFMFAWNFRRFFYNNYLLFLGVAYLFVAGLDFVHLLAYKGLGVFPGYGANLPTQLWIAARSLQAASIILTIGSELAFTFYISAYGFSNLVGHYFKIVAFYLVYRAIIQTGLEEPYGLMFRELQQSQVALQESEEKYRAVVENADEAIMVVQDGKIRFVNSRTQKD